MIDRQEFNTRAEALRPLFEDRLRIKTRDLRQAFHRAGRELPRGIRGDGALLGKTEHLVANPHIARQLEDAPVWAAFDRVTTHLREIDGKARRRGKILDRLAGIAFNILVVFVGFVIWLWWRGYV
ncbi:hypothetical protein DSM14862_00717 [Sulfitobacter indolifex]|jgi:hypothetical protein|uniref:Uncharacterized protein n=1 Tax=Sulfitobacter indolifex HEL-45 TaxID=391624 RepID=A0ABM9XBR8_9RHOB|nr:hypothetical protein [Sulfitobacter indolifex]EDQ06978.1 hypothetical protein OIHEL45_09170 [Sulfitobacter indolifex HEL-45]UOA17959.1 hypothetical protein DSM14862_00717 [Sulfitobacter indolifex]